MTVIAWDGETLAADQRASLGSFYRTTQKIFVVRDCLVGYAGDSDYAEALLEWYRTGADPEKYPNMDNKDAWRSLLVIEPSKKILKYERTPYPVRFPHQQFAIGSGRDFAMMAMRLGKTAAEAVELTAEFDSGCGNGVAWLRHP